MRTLVRQPIPHIPCGLSPRHGTAFSLPRPPTPPSLDHLDSSDVPPAPHPHNVKNSVTGVREQDGGVGGLGSWMEVREERKNQKIKRDGEKRKSGIAIIVRVGTRRRMLTTRKTEVMTKNR